MYDTMHLFKRLVLISNRLPVVVSMEDHGVRYNESIGGMATCLSAVSRLYHPLWVGAVNLPEEDVQGHKECIEEGLRERYSCVPVFLTREEIEEYYNGFCNSVLWPLFHDMLDADAFPERWWVQYQATNRKFAEKVAEVAQPGDVIWSNDYHLLMLPKLLRTLMHVCKIGFFLHTPFPNSETFARIRIQGELLDGILSADLVGVYTESYRTQLVDCLVKHRLAAPMATCQRSLGNMMTWFASFSSASILSISTTC